MFGIATYLTPIASKADIYSEDFTQRLGRTAPRQMLIVRAVLGEAFRTRQAMPKATKPPDSESGMPYDSVLAEGGGGSCVDHLEVMLYEKFQALPVCIATYAHEGTCECAECLKRPEEIWRASARENVVCI
jgi:hypothetical protein